jgi:hypothetical protein
MSQAFIRESDDMWLSDVSPTLNALISFLTRENNGIRVYQISTSIDADGRETYKMSNGLSYYKDGNNHWAIAE